MLLLVEIDDELADLFDENDDQDIGESILMCTFGIASAEVIRIQGCAVSVGVTLLRGIAFDDVKPVLLETLEVLRVTLQQWSLGPLKK